MRKFTMVLAAAALVVLPALASAQTANGTVNASARINAVLTVVSSAPLNFGTAIAPAAATISVAPGSAPGGTQTLGSLQISHNTGFSVSANTHGNVLTHAATSTTMAVAYRCGYSTSATGALSAAGEFVCTAAPNAPIGTYGTTQTTYLQVGGDLTVTAGQIPGLYTGQIDLTLTAITT